MKKKTLLLIFLCSVLSFSACSSPFTTLQGSSAEEKKVFTDPDKLESGKAYVLHDKEGNCDLESIFNGKSKNEFVECPMGDYNFKKKEIDDGSGGYRTIWFDSNSDKEISTLKSGDYLIYVSDSTVPEEITFERFADYGYTFGIANMQSDKGDHYYFSYKDTSKTDYKDYIDEQSDAKQILSLPAVSKIYFGSFGKKAVNKETVSKGGTVKGLKKNKKYKCTLYTGTYYQDFTLTSNIHTFCSFETFKSYDFQFMHSSFIVINIPKYFVSGYYLVNGVGLFRYVSNLDDKSYNGKAYDKNIDWNKPLILYNEDGSVKYDPSNPDIKSNTDIDSKSGADGDQDAGSDNGTDAGEDGTDSGIIDETNDNNEATDKSIDEKQSSVDGGN